MKKIDESQKRRFGVLAGLKDPTVAKREEKAEQLAKRQRIAEHVNKVLEGDFGEMDEEEELEEAGKHTKPGPTHIKGKNANLKNLKEMDMEGEEDGMDDDDMGMDGMGGEMDMDGGDMEMGADDGMGAGAEMGGGDEDLATRIITRVVDAIKAELGVDVSVSSGAPEPAVPGAGMGDEMGGMGHEEPDMDDMGGAPDGDEDDEMLHEDETFTAGGKATRPSAGKVPHAHPDHKLKNTSGGNLNESAHKKALTAKIANDIAEQTIAILRKQAMSKNKKK